MIRPVVAAKKKRIKSILEAESLVGVGGVGYFYRRNLKNSKQYKTIFIHYVKTRY